VVLNYVQWQLYTFIYFITFCWVEISL
jgi:hypothetical protein